MNQTRINYLLKQFASGALTHAEYEELNTLLSRPNRDELVQYIVNLAEKGDHPPFTLANDTTDITFQKIIAADKTIPLKRRSLWLSAAAAVLLLAFLAVFYFTRDQQKPAPPIVASVKPEKAPGRNVATLRLADNTLIELDSLGNRVIGTQGGSSVLLENGQLAYKAGQHTTPLAVTYNTITTPRGGEFMLTLPDGTKVWLNAASSLTFPTAFTADKRIVTLTGEAYLEVAEDRQHPFEVNIGTATVSVLGTAFNVNGYEDEESSQVTLLKGKVEVSSSRQSEVLQPGEQISISRSSQLSQPIPVQTDEVVAWKNGRIYFNNANIRKIMRQISRWYDVDIAYEENTTNLDFTCMVSRRDKLSKLLNLLELTGSVKFTMKGNTLYVH